MKSEISNYFKTHKNIYVNELLDIPSNGYSSNYKDTRTQVFEFLEQEGADDYELLIFECWVDGISKPKDIAKELEIEVKEVYNVTKRLERRLLKIQPLVANIL